MASVNRKVKAPQVKTHEGAIAARTSRLDELRRTVMSCFLWENMFYENGVSTADRIEQLVAQVSVEDSLNVAYEARTQHNLRHVPLWIIVALFKRLEKFPKSIASRVAEIIQRPDEMTELLALYWKDGRKPVPNQMKKALAKAFVKFNEYSLSKFDNPNKAVRIRDVMFVAHPKPKTPEQVALFKRVASNSMVTPVTWETELSRGADKKETFENLIREGKLGYLALLRNLRNMEQAGCDRGLVINAITARRNGAERVLPFRYVAAARHAPSFERALDEALIKSLDVSEPLSGTTVVLVDVSGSMDAKLSDKSEITRMDAAATLAAMIPGDVRIFTFSNHVVEVPSRRGIGAIELMKRSQLNGGTNLASAVKHVNEHVKHDRLIVITDEQANFESSYHGRVPSPVAAKAYIINVASYQNGVGYGRWVHIDGFSERVLDWIKLYEAQ